MVVLYTLDFKIQTTYIVSKWDTFKVVSCNTKCIKANNYDSLHKQLMS